MLFNSYPFLLIYLPTVICFFFIFTTFNLFRHAKLWLLISSLFFYGYWDIHYLPLLLGSIGFNYLVGNEIIKYQCSRTRKNLLFFGIFTDLALLFYYKYYNFFATNVLSEKYLVSELILPIGISFFTFTQVAFLIDTYQGKAEKSDIVSYGLFVTIFPHLIAGPILHHKEMLKQFNSNEMFRVNWRNIAQGIFLFTIGLSKKVVIADYLAVFVKPIFDNSIPDISFLQAWFGALSYTLQLYFDFSGYSDMAVGLGLLFNLHLPINFNSPYQANSIIDFWRRWHITLSIFLRDYLYIPFGGNRNGKVSKLKNLGLTMLIGGLWHGAGWTFIVWGACHGIFLVINHLWKETNIQLPNRLCKLLTMLSVIFAWVIFRSPDMATAIAIFKGMIGLNGIILPEAYLEKLSFLSNYLSFGTIPYGNFRFYHFIVLALLFAFVLNFPNSNEIKDRFEKTPVKWCIPCAGLFILSFMYIGDLAEFLYYQF